MVGRVYTWRGAYWLLEIRWSGKGPRNVMLHRVHSAQPYMRPGVSVMWELCCVDRRYWFFDDERVVRPFRGLRKVRADFTGGPKV